MSRIKSKYIDSSACIRLKGGKYFRIDNGVKQGCIMSSWLFNVYMEGGEDGKEGNVVSERWEKVEIA